MRFSELIKKEKIFLYEKLHTKDKFEFLKIILNQTLENTEYQNKLESIWKALYDREFAMSTGIGGGIAIPHCTTTEVNEIISSLTILKENLNFQSIDSSPVNIIVLLVISKNNFDNHIKALACVARTFQNKQFKEQLLNSSTIEEIYHIIQNT